MTVVKNISPSFCSMPAQAISMKKDVQDYPETKTKTSETEDKKDKDALMKFLTIMASLNAIKHSRNSMMNPMFDPTMNPAMNPAMNPPTFVVPPMTVPGVPGGIMM